MSKVFLIPGLGADKRIFKNLKPGNAETVYINWLEPEPWDTLVTYAQKLIDKYDIKAGDIVIGNSLGGMLAVEIAHKIKLGKVILISSIKTIDEEPGYFSFFRHVPVHKLIPATWFTKMGKVITPLFGRMYPIDAYVFDSMLQNTSPIFIKWAMGAALKWQNKTIPQKLYHITGDNDMIFNYKLIKNATIIKGGTHIMILTDAPEINQWLAQILNN
jgi:pimeloyl-ACP methyl ester carboxylesterase